MECAVLLLSTAAAASTPAREAPVITGLDHIPVAVRDLAGAAERYRELGFALKPGRPHDNGIRNQHVKFRDGTEIELITAAEARDDLTAGYLRHLAAGDGPAFVSFFAPALDRVAERLDSTGMAYRRGAGLLAFAESDALRYVFFGQRNHSPTDLPEHFAHANGAESLIGVWLAADDLSAELGLLSALGLRTAVEEVRAPQRQEAMVAHLREGEVVFLPASGQTVPGRRIVGATVRVRSLAAARQALEAGAGEVAPVVEHRSGRSVFVPPQVAHGIWLEFREPR
jgi:catechol 2,3-dioxygenase-like lactoylglutathione lyase family enzyme